MRRRHGEIELDTRVGNLGYPAQPITPEEEQLILEFARDNNIPDRVNLIGKWVIEMDKEHPAELKEAMRKFLGVENVDEDSAPVNE